MKEGLLPNSSSINRQEIGRLNPSQILLEYEKVGADEKTRTSTAFTAKDLTAARLPVPPRPHTCLVLQIQSVD